MDSSTQLAGSTNSEQAASRRSRAFGLFCLVAVALIWITASYVTQSLVSRKDLDHAAKMPPFVLTYIANSLFIICLPLWAINQRAARRYRCERRNTDDGDCAVLQLTDADAVHAVHDAHASTETQQLVQHGTACSSSAVHVKAQHGTWMHDDTWRIVRAAAVVCPLWFGAQLCFNASLSRTTVTANTILSAPSSLFTFALSIAFLHERFSFGKLASILLCIAGTMMVTFADARSSNNEGGSLIGDALALAATALYATYTVVMKAMLRSDAEASMALFFGCMGCMNAVAFAPLLLLLCTTGAITLSSIPAQAYAIAVGKGLFDNVLSDYLWARAVLLLGPTIATVGLSLQIPIAMVVDFAIGKARWALHAASACLTLLGTTFVLAGFTTINTGWPMPSSLNGK